MTRWLVLALVLLAAPAWASPITFTPPDAVNTATFLGAPWVTGLTVGVREIPGQYRDELVGVFYLTAVPPKGTLPFTAMWALDGTPVAWRHEMLADADYGSLPPGALLSVVIELMLPTVLPLDYATHHLTLDVTIPADARHYDFGVLQPTPEPATMLLMGGTLLAIGWVAKRRTR